jgi:hypothetical chaperone protein
MTQNTLGIDFGTSNSAAGIAVNGKPYLVDIEPGEKTIPTAIFFDFEARKTVFGVQANRALMAGLEGRYMRALKSILGTPLMHEKRRYLGETLSFVDIIARILARIKKRAEEACYQRFDYALSGRPVHFHSDNAARDAQALADLTQCYLRAGFKGVDFMFEPEAAALAANPAGDGNTVHLIVDIGGGTSDFTLFRKTASGIDILASHGVRIGGTNFDRSISFDHVMPALGRGAAIRKAMGAGTLSAPNKLFYDLATWQMIPFLYTPEVLQEVAHLRQQAVNPLLFGRLFDVLESQLGHDVAFAVEAGKISANKTTGTKGIINLSIVEKGLQVALAQNMLTASLADHMGAIKAGVLETLKAAEIGTTQVGTVVFVGGSSLMKDVQNLLGELFPLAEVHQTEAFTAVVDGLALAATARNHR